MLSRSVLASLSELLLCVGAIASGKCVAAALLCTCMGDGTSV